MAHVDLTTTVGGVLTLANPFWIASSHHSENMAAIRAWRELEPAAITLKTCTKIDREEKDKKRLVREATQAYLPRYGRAYYSDGPKTRELKSYAEVAELLKDTKRVLDKSKVGVSVLATDHEDFPALKTLCPDADFFELNLKYSMRSSVDGEPFFEGLKARLDKVREVIAAFLAAFAGQAVFIKLSRELEWLPGTQEVASVLDPLKEHGRCGLIVANSRKLDVGRFIFQDEEKVLEGGVISGDPLYDSTLRMIKGLEKDCTSRGIPIVASGGVVDEQQALMAIKSGADAVQLCTAFDYNGPVFYHTLVAGLRGRIRWRGLVKMSDYAKELRNEKGVASVFSTPFMYYPSFWSDEFQKQIQQDIRFSRRMDFVLTSGRTLFDAWTIPLTERVTTRFHSIRALFLNPDSEAFAVVQQTWGISDKDDVQYRARRVREAKSWLEDLFRAGTQALAEHIKRKDQALRTGGGQPLSEALMSVVSGVSKGDLLQVVKQANYDRRDDAEPLPCPEWAARLYRKCPFYSMYIFDDKAYVAMYPFTQPSKQASPVYVYLRSSGEYDRLDRELQMLWAHSGQMPTSAVVAEPLRNSGE